ncbi:MAG: hypothetical protein PHT19_07365 [Methylococcus sp.]|nr:hypothetical protein [Methylococcus sp.]
MKDKVDPVFIHSLHRSGSTYVFNAFRRAQKNGNFIYTAFQEPIHELAVYARENPETLLNNQEAGGQLQKLLRHPALDRPYFIELYEVFPCWKAVLRPEIVYADYFGNCAIDQTVFYLQALVNASQQRVVIQECRTPVRMSLLKQQLGGIHIHLWRNPWDQWWSLKVADYFNVIYQIILNADLPPEPIERLKSYIGFVSCPSKDLSAQFQFYKFRRLSPEASYLVSFMLLMLALIDAENVVDFDINIDRLSSDPEYRQRIQSSLELKGVEGVDFSDCASPRAPFGKTDRDFFAPLEDRVLSWLKCSGYDHEVVERADERRRQAATVHLPHRKESHRLLDEIDRRGDIVFRLERGIASEMQSLYREFESVHQVSMDDRAAHAKALESVHQALMDERTAHAKELESVRQVLTDEQAERAVEQAHNRLIEAEWGAAKGRIEELTAELALRVADIQVFQQELASVRQALTSEQAMHVVAQERNRFIEIELGVTKGRIERLASELALRVSDIQVSYKELASVRLAHANQQTALREEQERSRWLESEWGTAKAKVEELNGIAHHWYAVAEQRDRSLASLYASGSWRVTLPLRILWDVGYRSFEFSERGIKILGSMVRWPVRRAMRMLLQHPQSGPIASANVFAEENNPSSDPVALAEVSPEENTPLSDPIRLLDLSHLSPRARHIYVDLKAAFERRQKEEP